MWIIHTFELIDFLVLGHKDRAQANLRSFFRQNNNRDICWHSNAVHDWTLYPRVPWWNLFNLSFHFAASTFLTNDPVVDIAFDQGLVTNGAPQSKVYGLDCSNKFENETFTSDLAFDANISHLLTIYWLNNVLTDSRL